MSEQKGPSLFGSYFNLHPQDAFKHVQELTNALDCFTDAFKERIQIEIDYSKAILKVSKKLQKYINPEEPTPISYISSAFKVEHEQRARHALQLAQYLHTEIQVPCQMALQEIQVELKNVEKEFKKMYKEGEAVQEAYQKSLKKYFRARQDWEERMISKNVLYFTPGVTTSMKERAIEKLEQEKQQNDEYYYRYSQAMDMFNSFADRYNKSINNYMDIIQGLELRGLSIQTDSLRKLIVSEVNMFKNIEYDLLNISKQMEQVTPSSQIQCFVMNNKDNFISPIISIYAEGPVVANRYEIIDLKYTLKRSLLEETLLRIDKGLFTWLLENKNNSTLRYVVQKLLKRYSKGNEQEGSDYLQEFQDAINNNKTVKEMPMDGVGKERYMNVEEVSFLSLGIVQAICEILEPGGLYENKIKSLYERLDSYLSIHHFYRFLAFLTLDEYHNSHDQKVEGKNISEHYLHLLQILLDKVKNIILQSLKAKDVFIARSTLIILFSASYTTDPQNKENRYFYQQQAIQDMQLWQDRDFWQAAIFQATYELITSLPTVERSELRQVYLMRQKNVIFSELLSYCHYMIMLGVQINETKSVIGRISQIYNLYDQHERDLVKTINKSNEEYKRIQG